MKLKHLLILAVLALTGCGKSSTNPDPEPVVTVNGPAKATLTFPAQNSVCNSGTVISTTQASVVLSWAGGANTDSYEVDVKNLLTGAVTVQTATTNQLTVTLLRGTPYSWYVVSKSGSVTATATSDTWKFYMAGLGVTSYAPFPASVTAPTFGQVFAAATATVNLSWAGSDTDNDISGYDVYFGTTASPTVYKSNVSDMFVNNVPVTSGNTYYWRVVTKDSQGNTSNSELFQFKVN